MKKTEHVDIISIFDATRKNIERDSEALAGKAELLNEIINYFVSNNLTVTKEVEVKEETKIAVEENK